MLVKSRENEKNEAKKIEGNGNKKHIILWTNGRRKRKENVIGIKKKSKYDWVKEEPNFI